MAVEYKSPYLNYNYARLTRKLVGHQLILAKFQNYRFIAIVSQSAWHIWHGYRSY